MWVARLSRPAKANALTRAMLTDLAAFAETAQGRARALVLTGTGRVFSAGMDLTEAEDLAADPLWERVSGAVAAFRGLSIAALNGTAAGGALGMVLACDLRIAVPGAQIFYPVMARGYLPQPSDPVRLARLAGPGRAAMLLLAGQKVGVEEALAWGLVDRVVPAEDLDAASRDLAAVVLAADPAHAAAIKEMIR
nr:enoyl-CoA hydratase/isomerase family protein [Mangrovicoccus algicola]